MRRLGDAAAKLTGPTRVLMRRVGIICAALSHLGRPRLGCHPGPTVVTRPIATLATGAATKGHLDPTSAPCSNKVLALRHQVSRGPGMVERLNR